MSNPIPSLLALTSIADGSQQQAAPIRNNYSAVQTAVNALITALKGGTTGALLYATDASDVAYLPDVPVDMNALIWSAALSRWVPAYPPSHEIAYVEATGFTVITATTEATAQSIVSSGAVTFDGTSVVLEFFVPRVALTSTSGSSVTAYLYADGVSVGILSQIVNPGAALSSGVAVPVRATRRLTPSAGSHTYSVRFAGSVSGAEVDAGAGGTGAFLPGFIRITKA